MTIAQKNPALQIIDRDLGHQVGDAKPHWKKAFPLHVKSQMVEFQAPDLFTHQPGENTAVFLLRYIMHNWAATPLRNLCATRQPTTQPVLIEKFLSVATAPSANKASIPSGPLLPS